MVQTSNFQIINEYVLAPLPALPPLHPPSPNPLTSPKGSATTARWLLQRWGPGQPCLLLPAPCLQVQP